MPAFDQSTRLAKLYTPLPDGDVVLLDMHGSEYVNGNTVFYVRTLTDKDVSAIEPLLGEPMCIEISTAAGAPRYFHLLVDAIHYVGRADQNHIFEFELRPWLWMLGRRVNSRIFKEMSVIDIIKAIAAEHGIGSEMKLSDEVTSPGGAVEYVVQYNESDRDFILRLMEQEGINQHCVMAEKSHTIVMSNRTDSFPKAPGPARSYSPLGDRGDQTTENFDTWLPRRQVTSGITRMTDYNFKTPKAGMETESDRSQSAPFSNLERFVYPGNYLDGGAGNKIAKRRTEAVRTGDAIVKADGNLASLGAGMRFDLGAHPDAAQQGEYAVLAAHHTINNGSFGSGQNNNDHGSYRGAYQLCRSSVPVAPLPQTPCPRIAGPQTATVLDGADGGLDEWGRITLKFHWAPDAESMRCRVSQIWAGQDWGSVFIPHTGMEVIVEFLDGNPDRPLVTGCVWNQDARPSFPEHKLVSGFKTVRDNRLLFIDEDGKEMIGIRAQKDMVTVVMNDDKHVVHNNRTTKITTNVTETVGGDVKTTVNGKEDHKVTGALTIESTAKIELKVGSSSITIEPTSITIKAVTVTVEATAALSTKGGATAEHKAGGPMTIQAAIVNIN